MDKENFEEDKTINSIARTIFRYGIQDELNNYISHGETTVSLVLPLGIGTLELHMTPQIYRKVLSRLELRKRITAGERKEYATVAKHLLDILGYNNLINSDFREIGPNKTKIIIKVGDVLHVIEVSLSPDILLDIINEQQHYRDSMRYHCTGEY